jgi:hypothetical protein
MLAVGIGAIPMFREVYPWFFTFRTMGVVGGSLALNIPFMPDYVEKNSIGKASSILQIVTLAS